MLLRWSCQFVFDSLKPFSINQLLRWNHYKALELSPSASLGEIKAAYYRLSKIHHPDRNNGSEASAKKFRDIVAAYEVLGKPDSRRKYDREIVKKFESRNTDAMHRKKGSKRNKKNLSSAKTKTNFKSSNRAKTKSRTGGVATKGMVQNEQEDFETFIVRAIPLVVACLLCCRKR